MERLIGEHFDYDGTTLEVVKCRPCRECYFLNRTICFKGYNNDIAGSCCPMYRSDRTSVIFKEMEPLWKGRLEKYLRAME